MTEARARKKSNSFRFQIQIQIINTKGNCIFQGMDLVTGVDWWWGVVEGALDGGTLSLADFACSALAWASLLRVYHSISIISIISRQQSNHIGSISHTDTNTRTPGTHLNRSNSPKYGYQRYRPERTPMVAPTRRSRALELISVGGCDAVM